MAAAERPATRRRGRRPGFDLEQLPTTYTNKWAIFGAQEEEGEEVSSWEISGTLGEGWLEGQLAGHHSVPNNNTSF